MDARDEQTLCPNTATQKSTSIAFYLLLFYGYIDDGGFGYLGGQFDINYSVLLAAAVVNSATAILVVTLTRKEKHRSGQFTSKVISR